MKLMTTAALAALIAAPALADGWRDDYQVVKFGILSGENEKDRLMRNEPLRAYLEKELGVEVEIFTAGNYDGVVQAIAADQIEVARFGSSSYAAVYTATDGGVVPTLTTIAQNGNTGYHSIVVTRCDSGIESLDDAEGKVHAFADPDSTSGYAVPYFNFVEREGIDPTTYFAATPFSGSHEAGVQGVANGTFDTASTYQDNDEDGVYQRMERKGMLEEGVICKIWESPEITSGPWTFRKNLPEEMIEEITAAIEDFPTADPDGYKLYSSWSADNPNPDAGFARVDHERYQWIIDMREWLKTQRRGS
ncbi:phosphate/phosphite/phosphonate ABC transporter substrate-binding protein [Psychromarinibacter sp. C21-152]|uniref:Phosphate/phosphite/phosphonate ABC transporter substrate-binding protein n=1 Tax=Psychromarinibacter sediminicola TaxID=3033385 RepID=A0AAE3NTN8_9RHOB|nr:phosphate/phosphite/phosphonate ABC transporter substrate-binding protein [Psychromarinibacter sediminicola]MDF0600720.1 phosphate/phosphite/phosphonate ABC transporter substrate-binding protein [Psychromarinibacter sediminicola]